MKSSGTAKNVESWLAQLQHGRSNVYLEGRTQVENLEIRLNETAAWCARNMEPAQIRSCFRPHRITPRPLSANRWDAVEDVVRGRRYETRRTAAGAPEGRLLVYFPDEDLTDGAAEAASSGFFDVYNAPPWGTWVGYFEDGGTGQGNRSYLLAWVPRAIVDAATAGIDVNPEKCIGWLADADVDLRSIFQSIGSSWIL